MPIVHGVLYENALPDLILIYFEHFFNQFAPGIFLVFPDAHMGLFLAKNPKKFLAINNFFLSMKRSPDTQINAFFIDILRI